MARRKTRKKTRSSKARKKTGAKAKIGQAIKLLQTAKKHTS